MEESKIEVREVSLGDVEALRPIFEEWVRSPANGEVIMDEVDEDLALVGSIARGGQPGKMYYVATLGEEVLGGMGFKTDPHERVAAYARTGRAVEIMNAYISSKARNSGVGSALLRRIEEEARAMGFLEVLVNSGPRYAESGWGFYDKVLGDKLGFIANFYGEGFHAAVWGEEL